MNCNVWPWCIDLHTLTDPPPVPALPIAAGIVMKWADIHWMFSPIHPYRLTSFVQDEGGKCYFDLSEGSVSRAGAPMQAPAR